MEAITARSLGAVALQNIYDTQIQRNANVLNKFFFVLHTLKTNVNDGNTLFSSRFIHGSFIFEISSFTWHFLLATVLLNILSKTVTKIFHFLQRWKKIDLEVLTILIWTRLIVINFILLKKIQEKKVVIS